MKPLRPATATDTYSATAFDASTAATPTPLPQADPADIGLCHLRTRRIVEALQREVDGQRLPGAVVMLARHGKIGLMESVGLQDPAKGTPMATDSIFRIYSMTKPIVSVAVMMLVERGRLLLSDPVSRHLPEYAHQSVSIEQGHTSGFVEGDSHDGGHGGGQRGSLGNSKGGGTTTEVVRNPATVHDLLRHTAGLTYEFLGESSVQRQYADVKIASRERSNAEFSQVLAAMPLMFQPGSVWAYSRATDVLGRLVEVISGQTLGEFLHHEIFAPLGMVDTGFFVPPAQQHRIAEPFAHDPDGGTPMPLLNPTLVPAMESGGGGLMSTAPDYARFLQCLRNRGELNGVRLLGPHTVDYMTADHLGDIPCDGTLLPPGHGFGLGFAVRKARGLAPLPGSAGLYYWSGIAGTVFFVDPVLDVYAMLLIQAPNQRDYYRTLLRNMVYAALQ